MEVNAGSGDFTVKGERSYPACVLLNPSFTQALDLHSCGCLYYYVSVPVRMVLAKTDVKKFPAVSCLCVHAARSSYQTDIIVPASRKVLRYSIQLVPTAIVYSMYNMNLESNKLHTYSGFVQLKS